MQAVLLVIAVRQRGHERLRRPLAPELAGQFSDARGAHADDALPFDIGDQGGREVPVSHVLRGEKP